MTTAAIAELTNTTGRNMHPVRGAAIRLHPPHRIWTVAPGRAGGAGRARGRGDASQFRRQFSVSVIACRSTNSDLRAKFSQDPSHYRDQSRQSRARRSNCCSRHPVTSLAGLPSFILITAGAKPICRCGRAKKQRPSFKRSSTIAACA